MPRYPNTDILNRAIPSSGILLGGCLREFVVNSRHPDPRRVWKWGPSSTCCHHFALSRRIRWIRWIRWIRRRVPKWGFVRSGPKKLASRWLRMQIEALYLYYTYFIPVLYLNYTILYKCYTILYYIFIKCNF